MAETPDVTGASPFGAHFFKDWDKCEKFWFYRHRAPLDGGEGLTPITTASPLLIGSFVHRGLEAYLISGATDGKYQLDAGMTAIEAEAEKRRHEMQEPASFGNDVNLCLKMMKAYHAKWGPGGTDEDYPRVQILSDKDGPLVEREFRVDLGRGRVFTARVDAIILCQEKWVYTFEHKTTGFSGFSRLMTSMKMDSQSVGQAFVLNEHPDFAKRRVQGVMLNVLVKDASPNPKAKVPAFARDPIAHADAHIEQFPRDILSKLQVMDDRWDVYQAGLAQGMSPWESARVFNLTGTSNGKCFDYNRPCPYLDLCLGMGNEEGMLAGYKPYKREQPEVKE